MISVIALESCYIFIDSRSVTWSGLPEKASRLLACQKTLDSSVGFSINPAASNQSDFSANQSFPGWSPFALPVFKWRLGHGSIIFLKLKFRFFTKQRIKLRNLRRNFASGTLALLADSKHLY